MAKTDDFYTIMGIPRTATIKEIKKAYSDLSKKYHPDRNPGDDIAVKNFQKIQEAYEILGDQEKRTIYDRRLASPPISIQVANKTNFQDIFDVFFNQRPRQQGWGQHIEMEIVIDFIESVKGCSKVINIDRREICSHCKGTTAKNGKEYKECVLCDGTGKTHYHHGNSAAYSKWETTCQSCCGTGKIVSEFCDHCLAKGYFIKPSTLELKIPAGINTGMKICVRGEGDVGLSGCGNLYCVVRVRQHPVFERNGMDILVKLPITYTQAVFGGELDVPYLDGKCKFKMPPGIKSGATFRMPGLGFKLLEDNESAKGDLLVRVLIDVPNSNDIPEEYKELLKKVADFEKDHLGESRKNFKTNMNEVE